MGEQARQRSQDDQFVAQTLSGVISHVHLCCTLTGTHHKNAVKHNQVNQIRTDKWRLFFGRFFARFRSIWLPLDCRSNWCKANDKPDNYVSTSLFVSLSLHDQLHFVLLLAVVVMLPSAYPQKHRGRGRRRRRRRRRRESDRLGRTHLEV
jgi:hypothetical protein